MSFLAPTALILGALAVPIILLYMLRLRRRDVQVSSTMLWQQILRDREANAPWQRLKRNLLMLLQLLILTALVIALARPFVAVPTVTSGRTVLLVDASASMNASDVQPSRFEAAKQQALNAIDSMNDQDSLAVIRVANGPEVVENYTNDRASLRAAINAMQPSYASADWNAALTLAEAGASGADKFTILVIGDGGIPDSIARNYNHVQFIPIGTSDSNMAITALATAADPVNGPQIYARVANYGSQAADVVFSVKLDGKLFNASNYHVDADGYSDVIVTGLPKSFHQVEASLTRPAASSVPDYLAEDDTAYAVYNPTSAGRVLIVTKQNRFLLQGFGTLPDWQTFSLSPNPVLPKEPFDLYVFDGWLPPTLPDSNLLIVNPPPDADTGGLFTVGAENTNTKALTAKPDDDRTRFLKLGGVNVRQFENITDTPWAEPLISTNGGPLLLAGEVKGHRIAILTFDVHDSDLPLNIAWPILLSNLTEWYKAPRVLNVSGSLHPGQAVTIQPDLGATLVRVQRPDGAITTFNVDQPLVVDADTPLPGLYSVDVYQGSKVAQNEQFAVNLFDENVSRIAVHTPTFGNGSAVATRKDEIGQREFWPWIALAALILLALEWYAYHRRIRLPSLGTAALRRFARRA